MGRKQTPELVPPARKAERARHEKNAFAEQIRHELEKVLIETGLTVAELARRSGVSANSLYNFMNGASHGLSHRVISKIVPVLGDQGSALVGQVRIASEKDVENLLRRAIAGELPEQTTTLLRRLAAGLIEKPRVALTFVPVPIGSPRELSAPNETAPEIPVPVGEVSSKDGVFGLLAAVTGVGSLYGERSVLVCMPVERVASRFLDGRRIVLSRSSHQKRDTIVCELRVEASDRAMLVPLSRDVGTELSMPWPYREGAWIEGRTTLTVLAVVIGVYMEEPELQGKFLAKI